MSLKDSDINDDDLANLTEEERKALEEGAEVDDDDPNAEGNQPTDFDDDGNRINPPKKLSPEDEADLAAERAEEERLAAEKAGKKPTKQETEEEPAKKDDEEQPGRDDSPKEDEAAEKPGDRVELEQPDETEEDEPVVPAPPPPVPADANDRIAALEKDKSDLLDKFDAGDITMREYQAGADKITDKIQDIKLEVVRAQDKIDDYRQKLAEDWQNVVSRFIRRNPKFSADDQLMRALDAEVKHLAKPDVNIEKLTDRQILRKAHKIIVDRFGAKPSAPAKTEPKTETKPAAEPKKTAPPPDVKHKAPPPTLAKMPVAESNDTDDGKWAALDRLAARDPVAYEEKLARMSAEDRAEYEKA